MRLGKRAVNFIQHQESRRETDIPPRHMSLNASAPWLDLFPPPADSAHAKTTRFRLLCRRGEPLLLLPTEPRCARASLSLYPAQTTKARFARALVRLGLQLRLPLLTRSVKLEVDTASSFTRFVAGGEPIKAMPSCAMLLGNPHAAGRRFVVLVFDAGGTPVKLIKAGVGDAAVALIRRESTFLKSQPRERLHAPALKEEFSAEGREAMALEYVPGATPGDADVAALAPLLESWILPDPPYHFLDLPAVQRLKSAATKHSACAEVLSCMTGVRLRPAVFHGDFTPWNVRVHPATRQWTVLDWERGESLGPPAWDWFHFVIQNEILVRHTQPAGVLRQMNALLHGPDFGRYSKRAGLGESTAALLTAYLAYSCFVVQQTEGQRELEALLNLQLSEAGLCR